MPHPDGGIGNTFPTRKTFQDAYAQIGVTGIAFISTTGEQITAIQSMARDGITPTITFEGQNGRVGNVCEACWGFRQNCSGTRVGQCSEALDAL